MRVPILAFVLLTFCYGLLAQDAPPIPVVFPRDCDNSLPSFPDWFRQTQLPYGGIYIAERGRVEEILRQYPKLRLQMSLEEVERALGKPDFATGRPTGHMTRTAESLCTAQVAYVFEKSGDNMTDFEDVAIYLSFSEEGKLYWVAPQNVSSLKQLGAPTEANAAALTQDQTASWKEYIFTNNGFAITLPHAASLHSDAMFPNVTVYTTYGSPTAKLSLRVSHDGVDCGATLTKLKSGALKGNPDIGPSSVTDDAGNVGVEYQYKRTSHIISADRFYCVNGRLYTFSMEWTAEFPHAVTRILNSFRPLQSESQK